LELVVQLTERMKVGGKGERENEGSNLAALSAFFPSFLWVLRDFTLELRNPQGQAMSARDYLEEALRPVPVGPNSKRGAAEKNRIRQAIAQVFHTRECVTLVRPVTEERDLQRVSVLKDEALRNEFRNQIAGLKELIPQLAQPKSIDGVELSGRSFVELARRYIASINSGGVPTIRTAFQSVQEIQGREAQDKALEHVQAQVKKLIEAKGDKHVFAEDELASMLGKLKLNAFGIIREHALGTAADLAALEQQFAAKHLDSLFNSLSERNAARAEKSCAALVADLWAESGIEEHFPSYVSFAELSRDVSGFWAKFLSLCKQRGLPDRVSADTGRSFLDKAREGMFKQLFTRLAAAEEQTRKAQKASEANQAAIAGLTAELATARAEAQVAAKGAQLELAAAHKEAARSSKEAEAADKKIRSLEGQLQALQSQSSDTNRQHAAQAAKLEAQLHAVQADVQRLEREKAHLSEQLHSTSHSLTQQASGASKLSKKLEAELAAARKTHQDEMSALHAAAERADTEAAQRQQNMADENEKLSISLRKAQKELSSKDKKEADIMEGLKQMLKESEASRKESEASQNVLQAGNERINAQFTHLQRIVKEDASARAELERQLAEAKADQADLRQQLQAAQSAAAAGHASSADNPLGLPTPTKTPLVSRQSLIPSKFSTAPAAAAAAGAAGSKRKPAAQAVDEEDEDMGGGGSFGDEQEDEEEDEPPAAKQAVRKPSSAAAAAPAAAGGLNLRGDPNAMTINELKVRLTNRALQRNSCLHVCDTNVHPCGTWICALSLWLLSLRSRG